MQEGQVAIRVIGSLFSILADTGSCAFTLICLTTIQYKYKDLMSSAMGKHTILLNFLLAILLAVIFSCHLDLFTVKNSPASSAFSASSSRKAFDHYFWAIFSSRRSITLGLSGSSVFVSSPATTFVANTRVSKFFGCMHISILSIYGSISLALSSNLPHFLIF